MIRRPGVDVGGGIRRLSLALLCAVVLTCFSSVMLQSKNASAAPYASYYGVDEGRFALGADGGTATDIPADTPTDTPIPTATDTPTATPTSTPTSTPTTPAVTPSPTAKPTNVLNVSGAAALAGWPQQYSNWCGIATVALIADYLNPGAPISQPAIVSMLNNPANQSIWSYPPRSSAYWGPYVPTDISGDFGTDPRSLAEGMTLATGRLYHVKVDTSGAWDTTVHIVHDLLVTQQPISVFVDHGQHSVIVSGVDATGNPLTNPNSITAIHVWDPGGGIVNTGIQPQQHLAVPIATWLSGVISWSGSDYFKYPYAANIYQGKALDPDPAVGPYAYVPSAYNHLWVGHYVYISPLAAGDTANLSSDWELNQYGTLIAGLPNDTWPNLPDGFTGTSVPMPTNPPPPPPPVQPPKPAPKLPPPPPPRPTPTPRATATPTHIPTATALPTLVPTATTQPQVVCKSLGCTLAGFGANAWLLLGSLLLLVLVALGFPTAIVVARLRVRRAEQAKAAMLAEEQPLADVAEDAAANEIPTATAVDAATIATLSEETDTPTQPDVLPEASESVAESTESADTPVAEPADAVEASVSDDATSAEQSSEPASNDTDATDTTDVTDATDAGDK